MENTPIQPALTLEEWNDIVSAEPLWSAKRIELAENSDRPHAMAALALYRQPFGFGWRDVEFLTDLKIALLNAMSEGADKDAFAGRLEHIITRIAALTPLPLAVTELLGPGESLPATGQRPVLTLHHD